MKSESIADYVDSLQSHGRYSFTKEEAARALSVSNVALTAALHRLSKKGRVLAVKRGFYVIVPLEYAVGGVVPAERFIDDLMKSMVLPYYVGLLTAAALHGAAHQQPQVFYVMVPKAQRPIEVSRLSIRFLKKAVLLATPVMAVKTATGFIRVSTPAATAIDLVAYQSRVGGMDRVATVLQELAEKLDADALVEAAKREKELPPIQRLGWLMEKLGLKEVANKLAEWIAQQGPIPTPLDPARPRKGYPRDARWNVIVNAEVEGEL